MSSPTQTMRIVKRRGPAAGDHARWTHHLDIYRATRDALLQREPSAADAVALAKFAFERACACAALGEIDGLCDALAELAAAGAAAVVRLRFSQGTVVLRWQDGHTRKLPPGETTLLPAVWLNAASAACIARDKEARVTLCRADSVDLAIESAQRADTIVGTDSYLQPLCSAFAALARGDAGAAELAREAQRELPTGEPIEVDSQGALKLPVARLIERLASGDTSTWTADAKAAIEAFDRFYAPADRAYLAPGFLPLHIAAVCAIAHERGARLDSESEYLPKALVEGGCPPRTFSVEYDFPSARARSAAEIRWWLDLAGVPCEGRSHRLMDRDGKVVARYALTGWDAVPKAIVEFTMDPTGAPLLDPGELLLLSDGHARMVNAEGGSIDAVHRMHLEEAITTLDEILNRLPPRARAVPAAAFTTARGRAIYDEAPGRFERERLDAVRRTYAQLLSGNQTPEQPSDPRAGALVWMEVIRAQLIELLDRLPIEPSLVQGLRPRDDDYERVFIPNAVEQARSAYAAMWSQGVEIEVPPGSSCAAHIYVAPAGMLRESNELSHSFPGGYGTISQLLNPHRVWVCWRYAQLGAKPEMNYDGLVWCDDHWAWFPKPYRVLKQLVAGA